MFVLTLLISFNVLAPSSANMEHSLQGRHWAQLQLRQRTALESYTFLQLEPPRLVIFSQHFLNTKYIQSVPINLYPISILKVKYSYFSPKKCSLWCQKLKKKIVLYFCGLRVRHGTERWDCTFVFCLSDDEDK